MSIDNTTPVVETENEVLVQEVPAVKTKKELKKERKEIKKHKKQVKKEARMHSAKMTKFNRFLMAAISIFVIVAMLVCTFSAIKITKNISSGATAAADDAGNAGDAGEAGNADNNASTPSNNTPSSDSSTPSDNTANAPSDDSGAQNGSNVAGDLSTKEGVVEYYKKAHAKVLAEAKSATRTYDNPTNYEQYLEVGGNDTIAGVAKQLMGMFMKENTEPLVCTGADIAANFPPSKNSCAGLTADMIGAYSCKEEGNNYIITLTIDSSKESPDLGEKSGHLVSIVEAKTVEDAAAGFVTFKGLENRYFAPTITATIDKTTGQMTAFESVVPSHMCFASATAMYVITVNDVGIGLQYEQKWTIEW